MLAVLQGSHSPCARAQLRHGQRVQPRAPRAARGRPAPRRHPRAHAEEASPLAHTRCADAALPSEDYPGGTAFCEGGIKNLVINISGQGKVWFHDTYMVTWSESFINHSISTNIRNVSRLAAYARNHVTTVDVVMLRMIKGVSNRLRRVIRSFVCRLTTELVAEVPRAACSNSG